jgi:hypothetical protein
VRFHQLLEVNQTSADTSFSEHFCRLGRQVHLRGLNTKGRGLNANQRNILPGGTFNLGSFLSAYLFSWECSYSCPRRRILGRWGWVNQRILNQQLLRSADLNGCGSTHFRVYGSCAVRISSSWYGLFRNFIASAFALISYRLSQVLLCFTPTTVGVNFCFAPTSGVNDLSSSIAGAYRVYARQ